MLVRDVMTADPIAVQEDDTLATVADLLYEQDIRHIPVVRGEELVGILSDRDLRESTTPAQVELENPELAWEHMTAGAIMSSGVVSVGPDDPISDVIGLMIEHKYSAIPVANELSGSLVGIVSYIDILRALQDQLSA